MFVVFAEGGELSLKMRENKIKNKKTNDIFIKPKNRKQSRMFIRHDGNERKPITTTCHCFLCD